MKLTWDDVRAVFEDVKVFCGELELYWYRYVWDILEDANLTVYNSTAEKIAVYSRLHATIRIYREFCMAACEEGTDFISDALSDLYEDLITSENITPELREIIISEEFTLKELTSELKAFIVSEIIEDEGTMQTIFDVLGERLGREMTFCSLWVSVFPADLWEIVELEDKNEDSEEAQPMKYESYVNGHLVASVEGWGLENLEDSEIRPYESYVDALTNNNSNDNDAFYCMLNTSLFSGKMAAYEWISRYMKGK